MATLNDLPLLADENIHPEVIAWLSQQGHDIQSVHDNGWVGVSDEFLVGASAQTGRVILTHDSDFGRLALASGASFVGIIYLRPGHIKPEFVIEMLETLFSESIAVEMPFVIVVQRTGDSVRVRYRRVGF
jgi:predicted nuclease of predicted toxin-antitoxin system